MILKRKSFKHGILLDEVNINAKLLKHSANNNNDQKSTQIFMHPSPNGSKRYENDKINSPKKHSKTGNDLSDNLAVENED